MAPSSVKEIVRNHMLELGGNSSIDSSLNEWFYELMNRWKDDLRLVKDVRSEKVRSTPCTRVVIGE